MLIMVYLSPLDLHKQDGPRQELGRPQSDQGLSLGGGGGGICRGDEAPTRYPEVSEKPLRTFGRDTEAAPRLHLCPSVSQPQ